MENTTVNESEKMNDSEINTYRGKNVNKSFNTLSFAACAILLLSHLFITVAMVIGVISVDGVAFTASDLIYFYNKVVAVGIMRSLLTPQFVFVAIFLIAYIVCFIQIVIGLIKNIIKLFMFMNMNKEYDEREREYGLYARTANKALGTLLGFIICSLFVGGRITLFGGITIGLSVFAYVMNALLISVFRHLIGKVNISETVLNLLKKAALLAIAILFAFNISENIAAKAEISYGYLVVGDFYYGSIPLLINDIYSLIVRLILLLVMYTMFSDIITLVASYGALNNGRKDVDLSLRKMCIGVIVLSVIIGLLDCFIPGMLYNMGVSDYLAVLKSLAAPILLSVGSIVLTFFSGKGGKIRE